MVLANALFGLLLLLVSLILLLRFRSRQIAGERPQEPRYINRNEELKQFHRMRRKRERVWFRVDRMHEEFTKRVSAIDTQRPRALKPAPRKAKVKKSTSKPSVWSDVSLTDIREKYETFMKGR